MGISTDINWLAGFLNHQQYGDYYLERGKLSNVWPVEYMFSKLVGYVNGIIDLNQAEGLWLLMATLDER